MSVVLPASGTVAVLPPAHPSRPPRWPAVLAWALFALFLLVLASLPWLDRLIRQAGRADLAPMTAFSIPPSLAALTASLVGVVLALRRPRHPVGWLLLALGLCLDASGGGRGLCALRTGGPPGGAARRRPHRPAVSHRDQRRAGRARLRSAPHAYRVAALASLALVGVGLGWGDGCAVSGSDDRAGVARPHALVAGGPQEFRAFGGALRVANIAAQVVAILTILAGTASLVVRFRLARQVERQQLRWLALAAALTGVAMLAVAVLVAAG